MRLTPGTRVGPYEVVALLGAGGMAEVYRAKDTRLGRDVAIKVVSEALAADGAALERFERESKLAASLAHPNVVALHDVGLHDGKPYFVTELLQGETLRERLAKGPIPMAKALEWAAQMAQGLAAAHEHGIVHRDLKPANVFLTRDGHLKLLDFGIAKLLEAAQAAAPHPLMAETVSPSGSSTGTGTVLGTPGYMSPEQVRGDPADARTDFFSLGAVLYEMLSGRRAFPTGPAVESGYAILHNEPEPLPPAVPLLVAQVVHRCLEKDAGLRFQSARDLAFNLELLRAPTGSAALVAGAPRIALSSTRRRRLFAWRVAGILGVVATAGAAYFIGRQAARVPAPSVTLMTLRRGTVFAARFNAEGRVLYSAAWGADAEQIFSQPSGSPDAQSLGLPDAHLLSVSPQGELAVSLRTASFPRAGRWTGGTLALVPAVGGAPRPVTENIRFADWSRTGELAVARYANGNYQLEYPLGTKLFQTTGWILGPRISPKGDVVAFWSTHDDATPNELVLVDRNGTVRHLADAEISGLAWAPSGEEVWFSEYSRAEIWASPLSGGRRLVYRGVSPMRLEDISSDGKVLVTVVDNRQEIAFLAPGQQHERALSWWNGDQLAAISDDGRQVLFATPPNPLEGRWLTYIRATDGASPVKLGPGWSVAFSPDEKSVLTFEPSMASDFSLLPVGVGTTKKLHFPGFTFGIEARFLRDGKRLVAIAAREGDKQKRLFLVPLDGGAPTPLSDVPLARFVLEVSRDDRFAAAVTFDGTLTLYPLNGNPPIPLPDLGEYPDLAGWTSDGQLWVVTRASRDVPGRLRRYDIRSRRVVEERALGPADLTGVIGFRKVCITPDGRSVAFSIQRNLGSLYLLDGLAEPRH